jgi:hypothetical protein
VHGTQGIEHSSHLERRAGPAGVGVAIHEPERYRSQLRLFGPERHQPRWGEARARVSGAGGVHLRPRLAEVAFKVHEQYL